nr:MAG TPA: hypothetical protein [Caudoviricetes sp.]
MKDEFKGAKGPWFWDEEGLGNKHHIVFGKGYPIEMTSKENKSLIAAAPELLEALRQLRDYVEDVCAVSSDDCHEDHPLNLANKAIKKALGKKQ